jgi:hypothetical protein
MMYGYQNTQIPDATPAYIQNASGTHIAHLFQIKTNALATAPLPSNECHYSGVRGAEVAKPPIPHMSIRPTRTNHMAADSASFRTDRRLEAHYCMSCCVLSSNCNDDGPPLFAMLAGQGYYARSRAAGLAQETLYSLHGILETCFFMLK